MNQIYVILDHNLFMKWREFCGLFATFENS